MLKAIDKNIEGDNVISEGFVYPMNNIYINVDYIKTIVGPFEGTDDDKFVNKTGIWIVELHFMDENIINILLEKSFCALREEETKTPEQIIQETPEKEDEEPEEWKGDDISPLTDADISEDDGFSLDDEIYGLIGDPNMIEWYGNGEFYFTSKEEAQKFIDEIIGK